MLPKTLYIMERQGVRADPSAVGQPISVYDIRLRLCDFNNLRDEEVGVYELRGSTKLTISGPGKTEEGKAKGAPT